MPRYRALHNELTKREASIQQIEYDLHATSSQISWTLSLFVLIQGVVPLLWSVLSELRGRKVRRQQRDVNTE